MTHRGLRDGDRSYSVAPDRSLRKKTQNAKWKNNFPSFTDEYLWLGKKFPVTASHTDSISAGPDLTQAEVKWTCSGEAYRMTQSSPGATVTLVLQTQEKAQ